MIAILRKDASPEAVEHLLSWIEKKGLQTNYSKGENETASAGGRHHQDRPLSC